MLGLVELKNGSPVIRKPDSNWTENPLKAKCSVWVGREGWKRGLEERVGRETIGEGISSVTGYT
jgi:hypothetical protein